MSGRLSLVFRQSLFDRSGIGIAGYPAKSPLGDNILIYNAPKWDRGIFDINITDAKLFIDINIFFR